MAEQERLLRAAVDGDLCILKKMARELDAGQGEAAVLAAPAGRDGTTALHAAATEGRVDVLRYLLEDLGLHVDLRNHRGETPLFCASNCGKIDTIRYLLARGADPSIVCRAGSALHVAAMKGHYEVVQLLLSRGVNVDVAALTGTPLHSAAAYAQVNTVKILLEHHANPNKVASADNTPLSMAIWAKSLECVKLLIKAGADVNFIYSTGVTYVIMAATKGLTEIMKCLLQAGADPNIPDSFGQTPIEVAALKDRRQDVEVLFPLTSRVPTVPDWSVDGIISHVKAHGLKLIDKRQFEWKRKELELEAKKAFKNKDYLTALTLYDNALGFGPSDDDVAGLLANTSLCWLCIEDGEKALTDASACRSLRPDWPKACYRQGSALLFLRDYGRACQSFADGLKLDPTNVEIENALRRAVEEMKEAACSEQKR